MPRAPIRREGFPGQHLFVLPAPVRSNATVHPLLRGLLVTDAGYFPKAEGHRAERPQGCSTHLLIVCLRGAGWLRPGSGRVQGAAAGDLIWLSADSPHSYGADADDPWTIVWAHFRGEEVSWWQRELGWTGQDAVAKFHTSPDRAASLGLDNVYAKLERGYTIRNLLCASTALRSVFCSAIELSHGSGTIRTAAGRTAMVREEMSANPARAYRLAELAERAGLSVPHFSQLFRRQTGYSPIDFLLRERLRRACLLLDATSASVYTIASEVGFVDPYYFSRQFHRIMGLSPRAYRKTVKA